MGKVTEIELPKDHPILKAGWSLATIIIVRELQIIVNFDTWNFNSYYT